MLPALAAVAPPSAPPAHHPSASTRHSTSPVAIAFHNACRLSKRVPPFTTRIAFHDVCRLSQRVPPFTTHDASHNVCRLSQRVPPFTMCVASHNAPPAGKMHICIFLCVCPARLCVAVCPARLCVSRSLLLLCFYRINIQFGASVRLLPKFSLWPNQFNNSPPPSHIRKLNTPAVSLRSKGQGQGVKGIYLLSY
jgi:hypothetical protein